MDRLHSGFGAPLSRLLFPRDVLRLCDAIEIFNERQEVFPDWHVVRMSVSHPIRVALAEGSLPAWLFQEDGTSISIPSNLWRGLFLWPEARSTALVKIRVEELIFQGYLTVPRKDFDAIFSERIAPNEEVEISRIGAYLPPVLNYLSEVARCFDLSDEYLFSKKAMANWIKKNPPPGDAAITYSRAMALARLLGPPGSTAGGQLKKNKDGRSHDPAAAHGEVKYPKSTWITGG